MIQQGRSAHGGAPAHKARDYVEQNPPKQPENQPSRPGTPHNTVLGIIGAAHQNPVAGGVFAGGAQVGDDAHALGRR